MTTRSMGNYHLLIILIIICGLIGGGLGELLGQNIKGLTFLKSSFTIGMASPVSLDLKLFSLTFGIKFNLNLLSLLGMLIGFLIYTKRCR